MCQLCVPQNKRNQVMQLAHDSVLMANIALTSVVCKIMAHVQQLLNYLHQHGLISHQQHGFLKRKSTAVLWYSLFYAA